MAVCGSSGLTKYGDCEADSVLSWQRWASQGEIDELHEQNELPDHETEAQVMVYACDEHVIDGDSAALTHDAVCQQPVDPAGCEVCPAPTPRSGGSNVA